jgi:hypothetical protein
LGLAPQAHFARQAEGPKRRVVSGALFAAAFSVIGDIRDRRNPVGMLARKKLPWDALSGRS